MKLHILSDLHNEFLRNSKDLSQHRWDGSIPDTDADIIVLAGDIDTGIQGVEWAIDESERLGKHIIYVPGNHEFYHHEYGALRKKMSSLCDGENVHCLDSGLYVQDDVRFIGATLWTDYEADVSTPRELAMLYVNKALADHQVIKFKTGDNYRKFKPSDALAIHKRDLNWIVKQLAIPFEGKTVVVTHHGPHPICQHPRYPVSEITGAFHSDLSSLIDQHDIALWVYGHTHANLDALISGTRILSNQAGYPGENVSGFDAGFIVVI